MDERDTTCCYARQDKFWVTGAPGGERWEIYTVLADSPTFWGQDSEQRWDTVQAELDAPAGQATQCCGGPQAAPRGSHLLRRLLRMTERHPAVCRVGSRLFLRGPREVDDPAGDVDGVVAETLVEASHQCHLHRHRQRHPARGQFGYQAGVQLVHLVVAGLQRRRG